MPKVSRYLPIISWYYCCNCVTLFRWEFCWKETIKTFFGRHRRSRFLCSTCAPTKTEAKYLFHVVDESKIEEKREAPVCLSNPPDGESPTRPTLRIILE